MSTTDAFNTCAINLGDAVIRPNRQVLTFSPENPTGKPGQGCLSIPKPNTGAFNLGVGWKDRAHVTVAPGETVVLGESDGSGAIGNIWCTFGHKEVFAKHGIIRGFFDGSKIPSFECPVGAFFNAAWGEYGHISTSHAFVNPQLSLGRMEAMPFKKEFRLEIENIGLYPSILYYSMDVEMMPIPENVGYFNAQYFLSRPALHGVHTVLDIEGQGHIQSVYAGWSPNENGWWGEGLWVTYPEHRERLKESQRPDLAKDWESRQKRLSRLISKGGATNVWTGTEDFFGGSFDFRNPKTKEYQPFSGPFTAFTEYFGEEDPIRASRNFGMVRYMRPSIPFNKSMLLACQVLGIREGEFTKRRDTVVTLATAITKELPTERIKLPSKQDLLSI